MSQRGLAFIFFVQGFIAIYLKSEYDFLYIFNTPKTYFKSIMGSKPNSVLGHIA